jgi:thymidine kinase
MYSGKTTEIIKEYKRWTNIDKKVICINHAIDTRYDNNESNETFVYNHDLNKIKCYRVHKLFDLDENILHKNDVILINEGQFFEDLVEFCVYWSEEHNKNIIVCGLDGDFQRKPFENISRLIPLVDTITKLTALCKVCNDGTPALFSHRITQETDRLVIGSKNYIPLCRKHYNSEHKH